MWFNRAAPLQPAPPAVTFQSTFDPLGMEFRDWSHGIEFRPDEADTDIHNFPYCEDNASPSNKTVDEATSSFVQFEPFNVWTSARCDDVLQTEDPAYVDMVRRKLDVALSYQLAKQLETDQYSTGNDKLSAGATATPATGSLDLVVGGLIQTFVDATNGDGRWFLHAPMILLPFLLNNYIIEQDGDKFIGPEGRPVAVLPGYDGTLTTSKANMYISGAVEYAVAPYRVQPGDYAGRILNPRTDLYTVFAQTDAILRFDPDLVFKATVAVT